MTFEKGESVRWLGHLDILRTFERAIRRAGLPIAFSAGFNPRERLAFASALSVGITGGAERATLELAAPLPPAEVIAQLNEALPPGIRLTDCQEIADAGSRGLLNALDRAEYTVVCACPPGTRYEAAEEAVQALSAQPQIIIQREREGRTRPVDIRPLLYHLALRPESRETLAHDRLTVEMILALGEGGTARPSEVITALAEQLPGLTLRRAHRVRLLTAQELAAQSGSIDSVSP
ncbi:MAG TPA: TIGR03936 family radical SAM-associated protein [Chthonomonadaceae bacterium]|nr:TIGR03936 family radical SAM-associated protein [Chthonomonadaceae bacterium]